MINTDGSLSPTSHSLVLNVMDAEPIDGLDERGWDDARHDLPTEEGVEEAPLYWAKRLEAEAGEWLDPLSGSRSKQEAHSSRSEAYYTARSVRLTQVSNAIYSTGGF
jgi:hypothetical protein